MLFSFGFFRIFLCLFCCVFFGLFGIFFSLLCVDLGLFLFQSFQTLSFNRFGILNLYDGAFTLNVHQLRGDLLFPLESVVVSIRHFSCNDLVHLLLVHQRIEIDHYLRLRPPFKSFQSVRLASCLDDRNEPL